MSVDQKKVRVVSGIYASKEHVVRLIEGDSVVFLDPPYKQVALTVDEARALADELYRLCGRIEARLLPTAPVGAKKP